MPTFRIYLKDTHKLVLTVSTSSKEAARESALKILQLLPTTELMVIEETILSCPKCSYSWTFGGFRTIFATCPQCMKQVRIDDAKKSQQ